MTSLAGKENVRADVVGAAASHLEALFASHAVDASHGILHARAVLAHADAALAAAARPLPAERALAVRLAALLHDADDKKYFGKASAASLANARRILGAVGAAPAVVDDVARMIHWVSCSANGNACPEPAAESPELLWPRWADRLEATGAIGVVRCHQYNAKAGSPIACEDTPRPADEAAALALATPERFAAYQASGGGSASMVDHYYDKLLQVARPPAELVRNRYLEEAARSRSAPLLSVCLAYSREGEQGVLRAIEALSATLDG